MVSKNYEYLRENGPCGFDELPTDGGLSYADKREGAWRFKIEGSHHGSSDRTGGMLYSVVYIRGEHDPVDVIEKWVELNEHVVEAKTRTGLRQILRRAGPEFHDAIDEVLPPNGRPGHQ